MVKDNINHVADVADDCVSVLRSPGGGSDVTLQGCRLMLSAEFSAAGWLSAAAGSVHRGRASEPVVLNSR